MTEVAPNPWRRRAMLAAPLGVAAVVGVGFWGMLRGLRSGGFDPRGVPSALLDRPAPEFALPPLDGFDLPLLDRAALRGNRPQLVNFFASWCVPCVAEHPFLTRLARDGVSLLGVAYKDKPEDSAAFLRRHGNPFARIGVDRPGRVAIDWGLYGVPETYLVDRDGVIRYRQAGVLTEEILSRELWPLLRRLA